MHVHPLIRSSIQTGEQMRRWREENMDQGSSADCLALGWVVRIASYQRWLVLALLVIASKFDDKA